MSTTQRHVKWPTRLWPIGAGAAAVVALLASMQMSSSASAQLVGVAMPVPFRIPAPAYDSGWLALAPGETLQLSHNLGGNPDRYLVDFQQRTSTAEIHNKHQGKELDHANGILGAHFQSLTPSSVDLVRSPHEVIFDLPPYSDELAHSDLGNKLRQQRQSATCFDESVQRRKSYEVKR